MEELSSLIIVYMIVFIIWGVIWGFATRTVIYNKGYDKNWFWWGFIFGFIAFIVALTKRDISVGAANPSANGTYVQPQKTDAADELKKYKELFDQGVITEAEFKNVKDRLLKTM